MTKLMRNDDLLTAQRGLQEFWSTVKKGGATTGWLSPSVAWMIYRQYGVVRQLVGKIARQIVSSGWDWTLDEIGYDWAGVRSDLESHKFASQLKRATRVAFVEGGAGLVFRLDETQRRGQALESLPVVTENVRGINSIEVASATQLRPRRADGNVAPWDGASYFDLTRHGRGFVEKIHASRVVPVVVDDIPMDSGVVTMVSSTTGWPPSWLEGIVNSLLSWREGEGSVDQLLRTVSLLVLELEGARDAMTSPDESERDEFRALVDAIAENLRVSGVLALAPGDKLGQVGRSTGGVHDLMEGKRETFVADTGFSAERVLMVTPGGLSNNAQGPRFNDHETLESMQEDICTPAIDRATEFVLAARRKYSEGEVPSRWVVSFRPIGKETVEEKSKARESRSKARLQDARAGVPEAAILSDPSLYEDYPALPQLLEQTQLAAEAGEEPEDPSLPGADEELLSAAAIGRRLGVSAATILAMRSRGQITGWKINGRWRFSWRRVQAALGEAFSAGQAAASDLRADELPPGVDLWPGSTFGSLFGASVAMREVFGLLARVGPSSEPVLLVGETGTGKEGAARAMHESGARRSKPFVSINCGSFGYHDVDRLAEAVLGDGSNPGLVEQADGGTLFLDEIGELPAPCQAVLLRGLQGDVQRRGRAREALDVRFVAATWRPIDAPEFGFRRDLFERIAGVVVELPPLREREQDVLALAAMFLEAFANEQGWRGATPLAPGAVAVLHAHDWPGNVRELRNAIRRAALFAGESVAVEAEHLQLQGRGRR